MKIWDTKSIDNCIDYENENPSDGFSEQVNSNGSIRRALCSMSRHNGAVTCVKFSPSGRFLASGSDDKIVLIWEKDDETAISRQFGEAEPDLEHWTVRKRLVAHENDVQDICWSPDGSLLVTVGLDRLIIIWSGTNFERIKRYDIHQSMVKGVVFDPANKFFATASDDRTVRIFRYHRKLAELSLNNYEFQMEHIVMDPFKKSPLTSYFRRMSWSPDGQHIAVPNATNGPVTSVAIVNRGTWATDVSLIGHEAPTEVCSFSPRLFEIDPSDQTDNSNTRGADNLHTILATGGQDRTLVVWSTALSRPLVAAQDISSGSITDICWSSDGQRLYFSSLDGSIVYIKFDSLELGKVADNNMNELLLTKYGADRESTTFPESMSQLELEQKALTVENMLRTNLEHQKASEVPQLQGPTPAVIQESTSKVKSRSSSSTDFPVKKLKQNVSITKDGKKRVTPILISTAPKTSLIQSQLQKKVTFEANVKLSRPLFTFPRNGLQTAVHGYRLEQDANALRNLESRIEDQDNDNVDMGMNEAVKDLHALNLSESSLRRQRNKYRREVLSSRYPSCLQLVSELPGMLFNNQQILNHKINQILNSGIHTANKEPLEITGNRNADTIDEDLIFSVIVKGVLSIKDSYLDLEDMSELKGEKVKSFLEVRNGAQGENDEDGFGDAVYGDITGFRDPTTVIMTNSLQEERSYFLYFPYRIQHVLPVVINEVLCFYVLASYGGVLQIIRARSGRYVTPGIQLAHNVVTLEHKNEYVLCVTSQGLIYVWKLPDYQKNHTLRGVINGVSLAPVINGPTVVSQVLVDTLTNKKPAQVQTVVSSNVKYIDINLLNGAPIVMLKETEDVFSYDIEMQTWIKLVDSWYFLSFDKDSLRGISEDTSNPLFLRTSARCFGEGVQKSERSVYTFKDTELGLQKMMKEKFEKSKELMYIYLNRKTH